jgi:hypothetical protein
LVFALAGCGAGKPAATDAGRDPTCFVDGTDPSLPGVRVHIEGDQCRIPTARHAAFRYTVALTSAITYRAADSGGACGRCSGYTADPASLVDVQLGDGAMVNYCPTCDQGCCPPTAPGPALTLDVGTTSGSFDWPGFQWHGPSDTAARLGAPFPAGPYRLTVSFRVPDVGAVVANLPVVVY